MKNHCDPSKRHDFVFLFDVTNGNPNGDPDAGNLPRVDAETNKGLVTDVCIKRKIRDYVQNVLARPIYIQGETALNTLYFKSLEETRLAELVRFKLNEIEDLKKHLDAEDSEFDNWLAELDVEGFEYTPETTEITYSAEDKKKPAIIKRLWEGEEPIQSLQVAVGLLAGAIADKCKVRWPIT